MSSDWNSFRRQMAGKGYSLPQLSQLYRERQNPPRRSPVHNNLPEIPQDIYLHNLLLNLSLPQVLNFARTSKSNQSIFRNRNFWIRYFSSQQPTNQLLLDVIKSDSPYLLDVLRTVHPQIEEGVHLHPRVLTLSILYKSFTLLRSELSKSAEPEKIFDVLRDSLSNYNQADYNQLGEILEPLVSLLSPNEMYEITIPFSNMKEIKFLLDLGFKFRCDKVLSIIKNLTPRKGLADVIIPRLLEQCRNDPSRSFFHNSRFRIDTLERAIDKGVWSEWIVELLILFPLLIIDSQSRLILRLYESLTPSQRERFQMIFIELLKIMDQHNSFYDTIHTYLIQVRDLMKDIWSPEVREAVRLRLERQLRKNEKLLSK